jgi:hypothetical protein
MNVTATNGTAPSFLTLWPSGGYRPATSNLNFAAGQTIANQVTVKVGPDGDVNVFNAAGNTDVIFDIAGYYVEFNENASASLGQSGDPFITTANRLDYDFKLKSIPAAGTTNARIDLNVGGYTGAITQVVVKDGKTQLDVFCQFLEVSQCKKVATGATQNKVSGQMSTISLPYTFEPGKNYTFTTELKTDQPGYPGRWAMLSITPAGGAKQTFAAIVARADSKVPPISTRIDAYGSLYKYTCSSTAQLSWDIGNILFDSKPTNFKNAFSYGSQYVDSNCAGFGRVDYSPGPSTKTVASYYLGVPVAQRDKILPTIGAITQQGNQFTFTASDNKTVVDTRVSVTSTQGIVQSGYIIANSGYGSQTTSTASFYNIPAGIYTLKVTATDNSGNFSEKTMPVVLP